LEAKVKQERKEQMKKKQLEISVEKERGQLPLAKQQPNGIKSLDQIMHLDLIKDKDPETISQIWNQHYANRQGLSAVLPLESYQRLKERSLKYPSFILPLPRDEGAEIFWIQFSGSQCYITSLAEYKLRVEQARPYVILTHYDDLANEKGIVLMRGELCEDDKGKLLMEANDAQLLVYQIQQFYVTGGEEKQRLLETFHERPNEFSLDQLLNEANRLS
jgi:ATP synthase F1 complex assembly factor 1